MSESEFLPVIIPVSERHDPVGDLYGAYKTALASIGLEHEIVYALDGDFPDTMRELKALQAQGERLRIVKLGKSFGEATALMAGFENSTGGLILTLPAYHQIDASELPKLVAAMQGSDMVIARRWPRIDSAFNRFQVRVFHWILSAITEVSYRGLGCSVRAFRRAVADEVPLYGDQHRFLPVLADQRGFRVRGVNVTQSVRDAQTRVYGPGVYLRRMLDILTVFFLVKFTKKPLRFFGLLGTATFALGGTVLASIVAQRLFGDVALADRPALLLGSLLVVLGAQLFALGLIGELIIFSHASDLREYTVEEIIN